MTSGGSRARSGPAPDPNALRRDRKDDAGWVTLPADGFQGDPGPVPLPSAFSAEADLWAELWRKPQAVMWDRLGLHFQVAAYVRAYLKSLEPKAPAGLITAVLRMEGELGLSLPGMHSLRWKFSEDEVAARRDEAVSVAPTGARARLRAIGGGS